MALHLAAKDPDSALRYTWIPPLADGDGISSATITRTSGTVSIEEYAIDGDGVVLFVSGGADGETTVIAAEVETSGGETLVETIYLPVEADGVSIAPTGNDVCAFALRKITGNGVDAEATELSDALERLNMMLAAWRKQGADVGATLPVLSSTSLTIPDEFVEAVKFNLRNKLHRHYGVALDADDVSEARRGLQQVKAANLPAEREGASYY